MSDKRFYLRPQSSKQRKRKAHLLAKLQALQPQARAALERLKP